MGKHANLEYSKKPLSSKVLMSGLTLLVIGAVLIGVGYANGKVFHAPIPDMQQYERDNIKAKNEAWQKRKGNLAKTLTGHGDEVEHHSGDHAKGAHATDAHSSDDHGAHPPEPRKVTLSTRFWSNFLISFLFITSIGVGSLFFIGLEYMVNANWSTPIRRIKEFMSFNVVIAFLMGLVLLYNAAAFKDLFSEWVNIDTAHSIVKAKQAYLNESAFQLRYFIAFGAWILFYFLFTKNSNAQDTTRDQKYTRASGKIAPIFIITFAFTITALSIDWMMTLSPLWFSTMFGVTYFAGTTVAALSANIFASVKMKENGYLHPKMQNDTFYSIGGFLFGFNCFWAYVVFCQFMLIWYSNIPEETFWYLYRWEGSWYYFTLFLIGFHFIIPLAALISRKAKVSPSRLKMMAIWLLVAHYADLYWHVTPTFSDGPFLGAIELGFMVISFGLVIVVFAIRAKNKNHVAVGDPKLELGLNFRLH